MLNLRAVLRAALLFLLTGFAALAQDVTLSSRDGSIEITGTLLGFDGEFFRVDTQFGELTVDGSGVQCEGPGCPSLSGFVAELVLSGSSSMAEVLVPALIEGFALRNGYTTQRRDFDGNSFEYGLLDGSDRLAARFVFLVNNTDEGFADLLANEADIVMALREIRAAERTRAAEVGMGDLTAANRGRVLALDAMVPIVSPQNPVTRISVSELARILSGEIANWQQLGGPDAPITVDMLSPGSGLAQAAEDKLLRPLGQEVTENARRHTRGSTLVRTVETDPFAIGLASFSETGMARVLTLTGPCGFSLSANRR